jgi:hypothetical protein
MAKGEVMADLNVLPEHHTRDDYDFDYRDGSMGPIRLPAEHNPAIFYSRGAMVWCKRHGWEDEIGAMS